MLNVLRTIARAKSSNKVVLFDGRSIRSKRTTGWERYAREISKNTKVEVIPSFPLEQLPIVSDILLRVLLIGYNGVVHFPTFPPLFAKNRYVFTLHDLTWWFYPETASKIGKYFYRRVSEKSMQKSCIVVPSYSVKDDLLRTFPIKPDRVIAVHNGLTSLKKIEKPSSIYLPKSFILVVGTVEPRKNLNALVESFHASHASICYELVIVGRLGWGEPPAKVRVLSHLSDSELAEVYEQASCFFYPSIYEGFGLPLIESLSFKLPIFCSDIPIFKEIGGNSCNFFDPLSKESITEAINSFVNGEYLRNNEQEDADWRLFTWVIAGEKLNNFYLAVRDKNGRIE